jgi:urease accessory protein
MTDGLLRLRLASDGQGRTRLVERLQRYPLTTTAVLPLDAGPGALIYVQNAAGSVFGGDRLHLDVTLEAGAGLCLSTPSATRLQGDTLSVQTARISVAEGAFFESMPDMLIPHPRAIHRQHTCIELAEGASAIVAETLAPGRVARGERHAYQSISLRLQVSVQGHPVLHDAATFSPSEADPALQGGLAREGYVGTLFALTRKGREEELADAVSAELVTMQGIYGGASPLASGHGAVARVLASDAPLLRQAMYLAWNAARRCLKGRSAPRLRK